jgi:hypothetical protein
MTKPRARKGELTGRYAVFFATWPNGKGEYVAIARLEKLREGCDCTYDFTILLAFDKNGGDLVLDTLHLEPTDEPEGCLCDGMNIIREAESFTDAFIYAHGLLSEGNRWKAAS